MFQPITNTPRDYAWGSTTAIAELQGRTPTGAREAELWLGTHPGSPAKPVGREGTLLDLVGEPLPFLLKVLAASAPLSLQAHPTPEQARAGFDREEAAGIPIDAPHRNYKDRHHKPELIYALSEEFRALSGFRPVADTRAVLEPVATDPRIAPLLRRLDGDGALREVFEWLITRGEGVDELIAAVVEASAVVEGPSWETVRRLAEHAPGDPGIAISLLLHTIVLRPGEALYLPAGNVHAYLEGVGIEVMAASDNVLRGGLTPKHVDVPELLEVLDFRPLPVPMLSPEQPAPGVSVFRPDVPDFELTVVAGPALRSGFAVPVHGGAIALCLAGEVRLNGGVLARGEAAYLDARDPVEARGEGAVAVAAPNRLRSPA